LCDVGSVGKKRMTTVQNQIGNLNYCITFYVIFNKNPDFERFFKISFLQTRKADMRKLIEVIFPTRSVCVVFSSMIFHFLSKIYLLDWMTACLHNNRVGIDPNQAIERISIRAVADVNIHLARRT